jgi:hypothetical protein
MPSGIWFQFDELMGRIRKGPLGEAATRITSLAQRRMSGGNSGQPSKPDDLSLILFRKATAKRAIPVQDI